MTPADIFGRVWDILVEHAGVRADPLNRETFVRTFLAPKHRATEWRFGGHFGHGGKFWRNAGRFYIACYREDETPKRLAIIEKVNKLLGELPYFEPPYEP